MTQNEIESQIARGCLIAERLRQELKIAESSWAHFEAINGEIEQTRQQFRQAMDWLLVSNKGLLAAIVRDAIMALYRIIDDPRPDGYPLIELSKLLRSEKLRTALIEKARSHAPRFEVDDDFYAKSEAEQCNRKIALIRDHVPLQWNTQPKISTLYEWRKEIELIRDNLLAHPGKDISVIKPKVNQIRDGHALIAKLVSATHHIFVGSPLDNNSFRKLNDAANTFWDYAQSGFIEAFDRDHCDIKANQNS